MCVCVCACVCACVCVCVCVLVCVTVPTCMRMCRKTTIPICTFTYSSNSPWNLAHMVTAVLIKLTCLLTVNLVSEHEAKLWHYHCSTEIMNSLLFPQTHRLDSTLHILIPAKAAMDILQLAYLLYNKRHTDKTPPKGHHKDNFTIHIMYLLQVWLMKKLYWQYWLYFAFHFSRMTARIKCSRLIIPTQILFRTSMTSSFTVNSSFSSNKTTISDNQGKE